MAFCGNKYSCDKDLSYNSSNISRIFESYKSIVPFAIPQSLQQTPCSDKCVCKLETCFEYGTCCMDILDLDTLKNGAYHRFTCASAHLRSRVSNIQSTKVLWMIKQCGSRYSVGDDTERDVAKDKCEHSHKYNDIDTAIPVTDISSNITYHNRYCLECNNIPAINALVWDAFLQCGTIEEAEVLQTLQGMHVIQELKDTETCNIIYQRPRGTTFRLPYCYIATVVECNVTGQWKVYDPFISAACHAYTAMYYGYNNIFCYMCNVAAVNNSVSITFRNNKVVFPLFSVLLKYKPDGEKADTSTKNETSECSRSQIYDAIQVTT